jgi:hypothetical protein
LKPFNIGISFIIQGTKQYNVQYKYLSKIYVLTLIGYEFIFPCQHWKSAFVMSMFNGNENREDFLLYADEIKKFISEYNNGIKLLSIHF